MGRITIPDIDPALIEFERGFNNALMYGEETYSIDEKGNIKFITEEELREQLYGKNCNLKPR